MPRVQRTPPHAMERSVSPIIPGLEKVEIATDCTGESNVSSRSRTQKRPRVGDSPGNNSLDETSSTEACNRNQLHPLDEQLLATIRCEIKSVIASQLQSTLKSYFRDEFTEIKDSLRVFTELKESVDFMSKSFDELKNEFESNRETVKQLRSENDNLKKCMSDLSERINMLEQYSRQDNIEINGIPENRSENLLHTVLQLGKVVSHDIQEQDILSFARIRKLDHQSNRPRSIVVKLRSARVRDEILTSVTKFNKANSRDKLNSSHLGYGDSKMPVFVSEHLSPTNKAIHAETRKMAREKGYKYVWVRDGRILVRKDDGAHANQIKSLLAVSLM